MTEETSPLAPESSPLTEADPASLNTLIASRMSQIMNTRPRDVTDDVLAEAIRFYREARAKFLVESQVKAPRAVVAAAKKVKPPKSIAEAMNGFDTDLI